MVEHQQIEKILKVKKSVIADEIVKRVVEQIN